MPETQPKQPIRTVTVTQDGSAVVEVFKNDAGEVLRTQSYSKAQLTDLLASSDTRLAEAKTKALAQMDAQNDANKARLNEMLALFPKS